MLVLTRRVGEVIVIEGDIEVSVVGVQGDRVKLGVVAPPAVRVDRAEIHERRQSGVPLSRRPAAARVPVSP